MKGMEYFENDAFFETLERLNEVNNEKIYSVFAPEFAEFGRVYDARKFEDIIDCLNKETEIPENGNRYVASFSKLEECESAKVIRNEIFGGMDIQIGYCNGKNRTLNGFEYHKCNELNVMASDCMLALAHVNQIKDNTLVVGCQKVFFIPAGVAVELFGTTLHLSPICVNEVGFKVAVVLAKGTNTPLDSAIENKSGETQLLLQKNKWVIAHAEREPLVRQGAHVGLIGENVMYKF